MDAKESQLREKFEFHVRQATKLAAEIQAVAQGDP